MASRLLDLCAGLKAEEPRYRLDDLAARKLSALLADEKRTGGFRAPTGRYRFPARSTRTVSRPGTPTAC